MMHFKPIKQTGVKESPLSQLVIIRIDTTNRKIENRDRDIEDSQGGIEQASKRMNPLLIRTELGKQIRTIRISRLTYQNETDAYSQVTATSTTARKECKQPRNYQTTNLPRAFKLTMFIRLSIILYLYNHSSILFDYSMLLLIDFLPPLLIDFLFWSSDF